MIIHVMCPIFMSCVRYSCLVPDMHVMCPIFLSCVLYSCRVLDILVVFLTKLEFSRQTFEKYSNMKCRENPSI